MVKVARPHLRLYRRPCPWLSALICTVIWAAGLALLPVTAWSAALVWDGSASTDFNNSANWTPDIGVAPSASDSCTINSTLSNQPSILTNSLCGSLTLGTGGAPNMTLTFTASRNLTISGNVTIGANGRITASGAASGVFSIAGNWSDTIGTANFTNPANLQLSYQFTGAGKTISGDESFWNTDFKGSYTFNTDFYSANSVVVSASGTLTHGANTLFLNGTAFNISGTYNKTCASTIEINGTVDIGTGGTHWPTVIINNGGTLTGTSSTFIDCDLTLKTGGTFDMKADMSFGGNWTRDAGSTFLCANGSNTFTGVGKTIGGTIASNWFHVLIIGDGAGDSMTATTDIEVFATTTVTAGATFTLQNGKNIITSDAVTINGTMNAGGTGTWYRATGNKPLTIASGGLLSIQGTDNTNRFTVTRVGGVGGTGNWQQLANGGIDFDYVDLYYSQASNLRLNTPLAQTLGFDNVSINDVDDGNGSVMMTYGSPQTLNATGLDFYKGALTSGNDFNVEATGGGTINISSYGGDFAGELDDKDTSGTVAWVLCAGTVTTTADSGAGSLRECINYANSNAGADTISFNIAGCPGGLCTISPATALPALSDATGGTTIDGYTQAGAIANSVAAPGASNAVLNIQISGGGASYSGITLSSANNIVKGLVINGFSAFPGAGVTITGAAATGNTVSGNYLGTNAAGTAAAANAYGVFISSGAQSNTVGGTSPADRNLLSGNNEDGIDMVNATTSANIVKGNYIGTQKDGISALANTYDGVGIYAPSNIIGGTTAAERNIIAGNGGNGVTVGGGNALSNIIKGNWIGVDVNGAARPNSGSGIRINSTANSNTVGGTAAGEGNTIANNSLSGILVASTGNQILGNTIYSNTQEGIKSSADNQTISMNLIRNNGGVTYNGVALNAGATNNKLYNNTVHANGASGVYINDTGAILRNNNITGNGAYGINRVAASMTETYNDVTDNVISPASMRNTSGRSNVALDGTDINVDPLYTNAGAGDFTLQAASLAINRGCNLGAAGDDTECDNASDGPQPDLNGAAAGNFNGFAPDMGAFESGIINTCPVSTTADGAAPVPYASLRDCINYANGSAGTTISFNIAAAPNQSAGGDSWWRISPATALPTITANGTVIDGSTQATNYGSDTNTLGPEIEINGASGGGAIHGLTVNSNNNVIYGLAVNGFTGQRGINILGGTSNKITGSYIGTNAVGSGALANGQGIYAVGGTGTIIGTSAAGDRNLVSGNTFYGIMDQTTGGMIIRNNYIGTDRTGTLSVPNGSSLGGVRFQGNGNTLGGSGANEGNLISGNTNMGLSVDSDNNIVLGNRIGTQADGITTLGNGSHGIQIMNGSASNTIGGTGAGEGNIIAFNGGDGVWVLDATTDANTLSGNSIFSNTGLGIDLDPDGVGTGGGANNDQAAPTISSVTPSGADAVVVATVTANDTIEFFRVNNPAAPLVSPDGSGSGEGYLYLGSCVDNGGNCSGTYISNVPDADPAAGTVQATLLSTGVTGADWVTATVTDAVNGTSEFAGNKQRPLQLVKQTWLVGGTAPLPNTVSVPAGSTIVFLIYLKNTNGGLVSDVRFQDLLDDTAFAYVPGTLRRTSNATPPADTATDLQIFDATANGSSIALTDAVDVAPATEVGSAQDTGGDPDVDLITIGAVVGQANAALNIAANTTFAIRFQATVK